MDALAKVADSARSVFRAIAKFGTLSFGFFALLIAVPTVFSALSSNQESDLVAHADAPSCSCSESCGCSCDGSGSAGDSCGGACSGAGGCDAGADGG